MAGRRKFRSLLLLLLVLLLLTGCWDRREVNDIAFVVATGFDRADGAIRVTVQVPIPNRMGNKGSGGGGGGDPPWFSDSYADLSVMEANVRQQSAISRQLNFGHRRVILFGESLARESVESILDLLARNPDNRLTSFVIVSEGSAYDLLTSQTRMEPFPAEMLRELAKSLLKRTPDLKTFLQQLLAEGIDPIAPVIGRRETTVGGHSVTTPVSAGLAIFRDAQMVTILRGEQAQALALAMDQAQQVTLAVPVDGGAERIGVRLNHTNARLVPASTSQGVRLHIAVTASGFAMESSAGSQIDMERLEAAVQEKLRREVLEAVQAVYTAGADPLGLGDRMRRLMPEVWSPIRQRWRELLPDVAVTVSVEVDLHHAGALVDPSHLGR